MSGARFRRSIAASLVALAVVYFAVLILGDSRAWSGSDAGGRAATAKVMAERGDCDPDVGYWAAEWDPDAVHHQLILTEHIGDHYVQATSVPFACVGSFLYRAFGLAGLALPGIAGALLAAWSASILAGRLGGARLLALWLVGLGPVGFLATDFWEHAPAVGLALAGIALALDVDSVPRALLAGLLLGTGAVLRAEIVPYAAGLAIALLVASGQRERWVRHPMRAVAAVFGAGLAWAANTALERAVLGDALRAERASTLVSDAGTELRQRAKDALVTTVGLFPSYQTGRVLLGVVFVCAVAGVALVATGRATRGLWVAGCAVVAVLLVILRISDGASFVPGLLLVAPVAVAGLVAPLRVPDGDDGRRLALLVAAVLPVPAIWWLQWKGSQIAQWGGRYLLVTAAILTVLGAVALAPRARAVPEAAALLTLSIVVGVVGLAATAAG
jgi:hypothetical protein